MYDHKRYTNWHGSPRWQRNSSPSRAPKKLALNSGRTRWSAKKWPKRPNKTPSNRLAAINTAIKLMMKYCPDFQCEPARGSSRTPSRRKYEILPKARRLTHDCQIQARRNNPNFKCELGLRIGVHCHVENMKIHQKRGTCRCTYTGMSTTAQNPITAPVVTTTGKSPPCPRTAPVEYDENLWHNRNVHHSEDELNLGQDSNLWTAGTVAADHRDVDAKNSLLHSLHCGYPSLSTTEMPSTTSPARGTRSTPSRTLSTRTPPLPCRRRHRQKRTTTSTSSTKYA